MISQAKNSKSSKTTGNPVSEKSQLPLINNLPNTPDSNSISPRRLPNVNEKSRKQSLGVDNDTSHNQPKTRRQSNVISFSEFKKQKEKELNFNKLKLNELVVDNLEDDNIVKLKLPIPISHENSVRSITQDVNSIVEKPDLSPIDQKPDYISANRRASEVKSNRPITTKPISDKSSKLNSKGGLSNITTKPIPSLIPPEDFQPSLAKKRSIKDNWNAKKRDDVPSNSENSPDKSVQADQSAPLVKRHSSSYLRSLSQHFESTSKLAVSNDFSDVQPSLFEKASSRKNSFAGKFKSSLDNSLELMEVLEKVESELTCIPSIPKPPARRASLQPNDSIGMFKPISPKENPTETKVYNRRQSIIPIPNISDPNDNPIAMSNTRRLSIQMASPNDNPIKMSNTRRLSIQLANPNLDSSTKRELLKATLKTANRKPIHVTNTRHPKHTAEERSIIKSNWVFLYRIQLLGTRLSTSYKNISVNLLKSLQTVSEAKGGLFSTVLKEVVINPSDGFVQQVKNLLKDPPGTRSKQTLQTIEKVLSFRMPDFKKFIFNERFFFCSVMQIERYVENTLLLKEGHVSCFFYLVLTGQVEIFEINKSIKRRLDIIQPGFMFGDLRMNVENVTRINYAKTITDTELLCINKGEYLKFLQGGELHITSKAIEQSLGSLPLFDSTIGKDFIEKIGRFFKLFTFTKGQVVQSEGSLASELFWLIDGTCKSSRLVPFISKTVQGRTTLRSAQLNDNRLSSDEKLLSIKIETQDLNLGDWFPAFPIISDSPDNMKYLGPETLHKDAYVDFYSSLKVDKPQSLCPTTIIADSLCTVATISCCDFVQLIPRDILYLMVISPSVIAHPLSELQDHYLQQRQWKNHKRDVVQQVLNT